jgi:hypothetical protein
VQEQVVVSVHDRFEYYVVFPNKTNKQANKKRAGRGVVKRLDMESASRSSTSLRMGWVGCRRRRRTVKRQATYLSIELAQHRNDDMETRSVDDMPKKKRGWMK